MKVSTKHDDLAVKRLAARWQLDILDSIAETRRARLFRVECKTGPAVLKVYRRYGSSGEAASIPFLRDLRHGCGPKIFRVNLTRTAVLMELLEGPTLSDLISNGEEYSALAALQSVAQGIAASKFRFRQIYPRHLPVWKRELDRLSALDERLTEVWQRASASTSSEQVIHGDLGFGNVIVTHNGPRLIDPKGLRAAPASEYAKCLAGPINGYAVEDYVQHMSERTKVFADGSDILNRDVIDWAILEFARRTARSSEEDRQQRLPYLSALLEV